MSSSLDSRGLEKLTNNAGPEVKSELSNWYRAARKATWNSLADVRQWFPDADQVGCVLIFNIRHNRYRLIVRAALPKVIFVKALLTQKEYDRKEWMQWA